MWIEAKQFFQATNYRELVQSWLAYEKANSRAFSFRSHSKKAGFRSPNYFQLVVSGRRNLGFEGYVRLSKMMKMGGLERDYFKHLVEFNQAKNVQNQKENFDAMLKIRKRATHLHSFKLPLSNYQYLSNWLYVVVREYLVTHPDAKSPAEVAAAFCSHVTEIEVKEAVRFLIENQFIEKGPEGFKVLQPNLVSTDEENSLSVRSFHKQMLKLADTALEDLNISQREYGGVTLALTNKQFQDLKKRIKEFRAEIHQSFATSEKGSDIFQLNLFLFPLTKPPAPKKKNLGVSEGDFE